MRTAVFTIVSPNYRHFARVVMSSLERQHPDWERFVLLVGGSVTAAADGEPFTTVPIEALPIPHPRQFFFRYTILELNTAAKPWMIEWLFARGFDRVVYFDPDIFVYSPVTELEDVPAGTLLALTPHLTDSVAGDDRHIARSILISGAYNLGFLAVWRQPSLQRFLDWWKEKLEFECVAEPENGLFVDQKWMDLAPGLFPGVQILRNPGLNVAYWNLARRAILRDGTEFTVNGEPLRFFHFSGFDPAFADLVSKHDWRQSVKQWGVAAELFHQYASALLAAGWDDFRHAPYAFGSFADGTPVSQAVRVAYRNSEALREQCGADPFAHARFFEQSRHAAGPPLASRVMVRSYQILSKARPLVVLFPKSLRTRLRDRLLGHPPAAEKRSSPVSALAPGLNVIGYHSRPTGVGESARLCAVACERAGVPGRVIDIDFAHAAGAQAFHRATIAHVNADQALAVQGQLRDVFDASVYNIGCWHWELPELPEEWIASAEPYDEIWAPSSFIQSAVSRKLDVPVVHMPHGVEVVDVAPCSPEELGAKGNRFTFLCMFDFGSVLERKNPMAAIEAFRRAFGGGEDATLLIKTTHAGDHRADAARLDAAARGVPGVHVVDRVLSRAKTNGLVAACDAVVSLHRSEGFGLVLAEAMAVGKPVVATGWSGNMDFMNSGNSCPVGYELVRLERDYRDYRAGQWWAEPDVAHAAQLMRRLVDDSSWRGELGRRARATIRTHFSPEAAGERYRHRLEVLRLWERE